MSNYLVMITVAAASGGLIVDGSTRHACQGCGAECWLSPDGQAALAADPGVRPICHRCFVAQPGFPELPAAALRPLSSIRGLRLVRPEEVTPGRPASGEPPGKRPGGDG